MTYAWSLSGGGTLDTVGNTVNITWNTAGLYTLSVVPSNQCGTGAQHTLQIRVFAGAPTIVPQITVIGRLLVAANCNCCRGKRVPVV